MAGPLSALRVVEFAGIGPGPFAGALLGDMGADVVRIDRPQNPSAAVTYPPSLDPRFDSYNRNKRSVALDLKSPEGRSDAFALIGRADILIEGFRPGVMERLGLGPDACLAANPRLVYGRMTGWGQDGPLAREAGHDLSYLALTGALHAIGDSALPRPPLNLVADLGGGALYLVMGVLSAVIEANRSGTGQVVDASMVDGVVSLMSGFHALLQQGDWSDTRDSNLVDGAAPFYRAYPTKDGKFMAVAALEPQFYAALLQGLGLAEYSLSAQTDRAGWPVLTERFAAVFLTRTRAEWTAAFAGTDACCAPVLAIGEVADHPHVAARGALVDFAGATHAAPVPRLSRTPGSLRRPAPRHAGEHNEDVMADWSVDRSAAAPADPTT